MTDRDDFNLKLIALFEMKVHKKTFYFLLGACELRLGSYESLPKAHIPIGALIDRESLFSRDWSGGLSTIHQHHCCCCRDKCIKTHLLLALAGYHREEARFLIFNQLGNACNEISPSITKCVYLYPPPPSLCVRFSHPYQGLTPLLLR